MPEITLAFSAALILVGVISYVSTGAQSITALIPSVIGVLLALFGAISFRAEYRKHAMHAAATVSLLAFLMAVGRLGMLLARSEGRGPSMAGVLSLSAMAVISLAYLILCIRSFITARRNRKKASSQED